MNHLSSHVVQCQCIGERLAGGLNGEVVLVVPNGVPENSITAVVDCPTQLICISDISDFFLLCQQTNTKDIAGQSATSCLVDRPNQLICISDLLFQQTSTKDIAGQYFARLSNVSNITFLHQDQISLN